MYKLETSLIYKVQQGLNLARLKLVLCSANTRVENINLKEFLKFLTCHPFVYLISVIKV